jgi:hypothetical protein
MSEKRPLLIDQNTIEQQLAAPKSIAHSLCVTWARHQDEVEGATT